MQGLKLHDNGDKVVDTFVRATPLDSVIDKLVLFLRTPLGTYRCYPTWGSMTAHIVSNGLDIDLAIMLQQDLQRFVNALTNFYPELANFVKDIKLTSIKNVGRNYIAMVNIETNETAKILAVNL